MNSTAEAQQAPTLPYRISAPAPAGLERDRLQAEALQRLQELIRIDTQNPPGNERRTALYLDSIFRAAGGFETHVLDAGDGRANFIARLRAKKPTRKPVLVMGHMDVVGVQREKWSVDPFAGVVKDGYLYGRGAIDDKGMLATSVTAILHLGRQQAAGRALDRDVIFLATAAEEAGDVGIDLVVEKHRALIGDAEFALNEGGRIRVDGDRIVSVNIQTTEKVPYNVRAVAKGTSGHGSVPLSDNALAALARAVARVHEWKAPAHLNETTRLYFERLATIEKDATVRQAMLDVGKSDPKVRDAAIERLSADPLHNAVLRTGASLTLLNGGIRSNVIPSEAEATFNVRILPGEDIREIVKQMNRVGGESAVEFAFDGAVEPAPPPSPVNTALFRSLESAARTMAPEAVVLPFMSTGATDGAALRAIGIPTYGLLVLPLPLEDELRMHGDDERVPLGALGWAAEYVFRTLDLVARPVRS
jgi:acetylornithine deacetylase/succinyl-diaminopimelate desuccinylase-like protein